MAILSSGLLSWTAALYAYWLDIPLHFSNYAATTWFALGGFLFGLGAAINQGCALDKSILHHPDLAPLVSNRIETFHPLA